MFSLCCWTMELASFRHWIRAVRLGGNGMWNKSKLCTGWLGALKHGTRPNGNTHKIVGVFCPHVWYQAVLCQSPLKGYLDPCRVTLLQLKVNVGLIFCQLGRFCYQLQQGNSAQMLCITQTMQIIESQDNCHRCLLQPTREIRSQNYQCKSGTSDSSKDLRFSISCEAFLYWCATVSGTPCSDHSSYSA